MFIDGLDNPQYSHSVSMRFINQISCMVTIHLAGCFCYIERPLFKGSIYFHFLAVA